MLTNRFLILLLSVFIFQNNLSKIRVLLSAAITDNYFEFRKQQYIKSFNIYKNYGYEFHVVEALKKQGPTFLDEHCPNVFYSTANDSNFKNNGINESRTILEGSYHFKFDPEDMIIKFTGRYYLISDYFLKLVENNPDVDAFVKRGLQGKDVLTLGFAMRCKYFQDMFSNIDYNRMERNWINIEDEVDQYIKRKIEEGNFKVMYVDRLDVEAHLFGSSTTSRDEEIIIF